MRLLFHNYTARLKTLLRILFLFLLSCQQVTIPVVDFYTTDLFKTVQQQSIFPDSKTFVDCIPKKDIELVLNDYANQKAMSGFDLKKFVEQNFSLRDRPRSTFKTDSKISLEEHLTNLWSVLTRKADQDNPNSSLIPLPNQYVVPGGRFSEIYYWDSYFTMLGLKAHNRYDLIEDMVKNFAFLIDSVGFIPNGNRNYYLSRSQPPFFSLMVKLMEDKDAQASLRYLPQMQKEYLFWMNGADRLQNFGEAFEHVVLMSDGTILNRYYDKKAKPRPEAYKEDVKVAHASGRKQEEVYSNLRSAAESGWDFSSRWFEDGKSLASIYTTDIVPVDLNCLLWHLETMIAQGLELKEDREGASVFRKKANERKRAILTFFWDSYQNFLFDYNFKSNTRTKSKTLAATYPLFFKIVQPDIAASVANVLENEFLKNGGLTTTLISTGEQWDAPNGWAPLQWMAYQGLKNYQHNELAASIKKRWLRQNLRVFIATGKMMEKYNVMDTTLTAGGGEYPNQDGFGWTNGVALAMMNNE